MAEGNLVLLGRIKKVTDLAVKNKFPLEAAFEVYNRAYEIVYDNYIHRSGGVKSDNSDLEKEAFRLTERYFDIQKIKELKNISSN